VYHYTPPSAGSRVGAAEGAAKDPAREPRAVYTQRLNLSLKMLRVSAHVIQKRFAVSHPTAMKGIPRLEDMGILREITGNERNKLYLSAAVVDTME